MPVNCQYCGVELSKGEVDYVYCPACGADLTVRPDDAVGQGAEPAGRHLSRRATLFVAHGVLALLVAGLGMIRGDFAEFSYVAGVGLVLMLIGTSIDRRKP